MVIEPLTPERRRQQTRAYLLRAAAQVFSERGFYGASLDEVAAVAGFTKGAVYSNFKNKDDLLLALLELRYEEEMERVRATLGSSDGPIETQLTDFASMLREEYEAGGDTWITLDLEFSLYAMRNAAAREKLAAFRRMDVDSVAEILAAERDAWGIEGPETPQQAAQIVVALMRGIGITRMIDPDLVDQSFLETAMAFLARGLVDPRAQAAPTDGGDEGT